MSDLALPSRLPAIVLPRCTFLPHGLLPLYIFEDRYRKMLRHCLGHDRMFCVVMRRTDEDGDDVSGLATTATAGLVRACVRNADGSSNLLLQGLRRVHLANWLTPSPFPLAEVTWPTTMVRQPAACRDTAASLVDVACRLAETHGNLCQQLQDFLRGMPDPETIIDIIAYNFIRCPDRLQQVVESTTLDDRIEIVKSEIARIAD